MVTQKTVRIVGIICALLLLGMALTVNGNNAKTCEVYWNKECSYYSSSKESCYCEGEYLKTTQAMIDEAIEMQNKIIESQRASASASLPKDVVVPFVIPPSEN